MAIKLELARPLPADEAIKHALGSRLCLVVSKQEPDHPSLITTFAAHTPSMKLRGGLCRLRQVFQKEHSAKLETWQHLVLGGLSGASAALATTPLDLIKTRLQQKVSV